MNQRKTVKIAVEYEVHPDAPADELLVATMRAIRGHQFFDNEWPVFVRASLEDER